MTVASKIYIQSDTTVRLTGLYEYGETGFLDGATLTASIFFDTVLNPNAAEAVTDKGGGKVGIPCDAHGQATGIHIHMAGSKNYEGQYVVDATSTANEIVITAAYVAETMIGTEEIYAGVENGKDISLVFDAGSDGDYDGALPGSLKGVVNNNWYHVFITVVSGAMDLLLKPRWQAVFAGQDDV